MFSRKGQSGEAGWRGTCPARPVTMAFVGCNYALEGTVALSAQPPDETATPSTEAGTPWPDCRPSLTIRTPFRAIYRIAEELNTVCRNPNSPVFAKFPSIPLIYITWSPQPDSPTGPIFPFSRDFSPCPSNVCFTCSRGPRSGQGGRLALQAG